MDRLLRLLRITRSRARPKTARCRRARILTPNSEGRSRAFDRFAPAAPAPTDFELRRSRAPRHLAVCTPAPRSLMEGRDFLNLRSRAAMAEAPYSSDRLVTVFGGSGFVGRHIVRALARQGWRVRVAVRRPDLAGFLNPLGAVGQIEAVQANLRYPELIQAAIEGANAVVNAAGVKRQRGRQSYEAVHVFGAGEIRARRRRRRSAPWRSSPGSAPTRHPEIPISPARRAARRRRAKPSPAPSCCAHRSYSGRRTSSSIVSPRWRPLRPHCRCSAAGRRNCSRSSSATSRSRRRARSTIPPRRGEPTNSAAPK